MCIEGGLTSENLDYYGSLFCMIAAVFWELMLKSSHPYVKHNQPSGQLHGLFCQSMRENCGERPYLMRR